MKFGGDEFEGPYMSHEDVKNLAGLYLVRCSAGKVLDLGHTGELRTELAQHANTSCWEEAKRGMIEFWVYYTPYMPSTAREEITRELRARLRPVCSEA